MNILFIGDVVGRPGRTVLREHLSQLIHEHKIDFTIVNGENAAHGKGITEKIFNELIGYGADVITMGNHTYSKASIYDIIDHKQLIVPLNMEMPVNAQGYHTFEVMNKKVLVSNMCTMAFMQNVIASPYTISDAIIASDADIKIVDLHGEATAEKIAYMHYYKHDLTAIVGTHTHIQTADEDIFNGCAYISDVGMCGSYESIIGRDIAEVHAQLVNKEHTHYTVSKNPAVLCGVVITIDDETNRAVNIQRIQIRPSS